MAGSGPDEYDGRIGTHGADGNGHDFRDFGKDRGFRRLSAEGDKDRLAGVQSSASHVGQESGVGGFRSQACGRGSWRSPCLGADHSLGSRGLQAKTIVFTTKDKD